MVVDEEEEMLRGVVILTLLGLGMGGLVAVTVTYHDKRANQAHELAMAEVQQGTTGLCKPESGTTARYVTDFGTMSKDKLSAVPRTFYMKIIFWVRDAECNFHTLDVVNYKDDSIPLRPGDQFKLGWRKNLSHKIDPPKGIEKCPTSNHVLYIKRRAVTGGPIIEEVPVFTSIQSDCSIKINWVGIGFPKD